MTLTDAANIVYAGREVRKPDRAHTLFISQLIQGSDAARRDVERGEMTECPYSAVTDGSLSWWDGYHHEMRSLKVEGTGI